MRTANPAGKNFQDLEDYLEQINVDRKEAKKAYETGPLLLCDIFIMVFRIYKHIEKTTKDITLAKILLAIYYYENLSQADIAKLYDIPVGTVGNVIAKYTKKDKNNPVPLMELKHDVHYKNRKMLGLTQYGKNEALKILNFIQIAFCNIKGTDGQTLTRAHDYLEPILKNINILCRLTTGKNDTLNMLTKYKKAHA